MVETEERRAAPDPEWVRGTCPLCEGPVVSNLYWKGGIGYQIWWQCWNSLDEEGPRTCTYQRVLL
jgi:hypothetical protein